MIFSGIAKAGFHNGGRIAFGPDGMLYVGTGDAGDTAAGRRTRSSPNGKILRLTPDGDAGAGQPDPGLTGLQPRAPQRAGPGLGLGPPAVRHRVRPEPAATRSTSSSPAATTDGRRSRATGDTEGGRFTNPLVTWSTDEASPSGVAIAGDTAYVAALRGRAPVERPARRRVCRAAQGRLPRTLRPPADGGQPRRTARCGSPRPTPTAGATRATATTASCGSRHAERAGAGDLSLCGRLCGGELRARPWNGCKA